MNELVWYSFPGILITLTLSMLFPGFLEESGQLNETKAILLY
jgi:hypothetical protein